MKIENNTTYTKENVMTFYQVHFHQALKKWDWIFCLVILFLLFLAFFFFHDHCFRFLTILAAILVLGEWRSNFIPNAKVKQLLKSHQITMLKNQYFFLDDVLKITNDTGTISIPYQKLSKVMETPTYFYCYYDSETAYLIAKKGFKHGLKKVQKKLQELGQDRYKNVKTK